jgi:hypothetical protein
MCKHTHQFCTPFVMIDLLSEKVEKVMHYIHINTWNQDNNWHNFYFTCKIPHLTEYGTGSLNILKILLSLLLLNGWSYQHGVLTKNFLRCLVGLNENSADLMSSVASTAAILESLLSLLHMNGK